MAAAVSKPPCSADRVEGLLGSISADRHRAQIGQFWPFAVARARSFERRFTPRKSHSEGPSIELRGGGAQHACWDALHITAADLQMH